MKRVGFGIVAPVPNFGVRFKCNFHQEFPFEADDCMLPEIKQ